MNITKEEAKKLYQMQLDYMGAPIMSFGNIIPADKLEEKYRNYFNELIDKYDIDTTKLQGIMPDGLVVYFEEVEKK